VDLNRGQLERRVQKDEGDAMRSVFVLLVPQAAMLYSCTVEMEDGGGARMRLELKGAAVDVTALSRTFWSERRWSPSPHKLASGSHGSPQTLVAGSMVWRRYAGRS